MQKFKQLYNDKNEKRNYREDDNGREYLFYEDKKERLIIRDYTESDVGPWANIVAQMYGFNAKQKKQYREEIEKIIKEQTEDELEYSLMVTTKAGKILGEIEVAPVGNPLNAELEVRITLINENLAKQYAESVVRAIWNLKNNYGWADKVFYRDSKEQLIEMNFSEVASVSVSA